MNVRWVVLLCILVMGVSVSACASQPTPTATRSIPATPTAEPTVTRSTATVTPSTVSSTAVPSRTLVPPVRSTASPTLIPTLAPTTAIPGQSGSPRPFGVLAVIANSPWRTADGWTRTEQLVKQVGATYGRLPVMWSISEPQRGQLRYNSDNDTKIQVAEAQGLRPFPSLIIGRGWMNGQAPAGAGSVSYPPIDLASQWNSDYGYSRTYYDFVKAFFTHYKGHFDYVAIEGEADSALFWGGTAEQYVQVVKTAYKAIKESDPNVQVVDSGFVTNVWAPCIARDWIQSGLRTQSDAAKMVIQYFAMATVTGIHPIRTETEALRIIQTPAVLGQCDKINTIFAGLKGSVDDFNFHFYENWDAMHYIPEWIQRKTSQNGYTVPVVSNEIGLRGPNIAYADGPEQAKQVFKSLVTALSLNLKTIVWFSADTIGTNASAPDKVSLFGPNGELRPAAKTFQLVTTTITNHYQFAQAAPPNASVYRYYFRNVNDGSLSLEALWSIDGSQTVTLQAPANKTRATVIDLNGRQQPIDLQNGQARLTITDAPVFVLWQ